MQVIKKTDKEEIKRKNGAGRNRSSRKPPIDLHQWVVTRGMIVCSIIVEVSTGDSRKLLVHGVEFGIDGFIGAVSHFRMGSLSLALAEI